MNSSGAGAAGTGAGTGADTSWEVRPSVLSPLEVKRAVQRRHPRYTGTQQHDAHEFLCECLDALEEEVTAMYELGQIPTPAEADARQAASTRAQAGATAGAQAAEAGAPGEAGAGTRGGSERQTALPDGGSFKRKAADMATPPQAQPKQPAPPLRTPTKAGQPVQESSGAGTAQPEATFATPAGAGAEAGVRAGSEEQVTPVKAIIPLHRTLCPTRRNFTTAVAATLRCVQCGDAYTRHETFRNLSIELPAGGEDSGAPIELAALLSGFFASEVLERNCEKPGCRGTHAELTRRIVRLPRVLILHLKRFLYVQTVASAGTVAGTSENVPPLASSSAHVPQVGKPPPPPPPRFVKVMSRVAIPQDLSLEEFTVDVAGGSGVGGSESGGLLRGPPPVPVIFAAGAKAAWVGPETVAARDPVTAETGVLRAKVRGRATLAAPGSATTPAMPRRLNLEAPSAAGDAGAVAVAVSAWAGCGVDMCSDGSRDGFGSDDVTRHPCDVSSFDDTGSGGGGGGVGDVSLAGVGLAQSASDAAHEAEIDAAIRASMGEEVPMWVGVSEEEQAVKLAIEMSLVEANDDGGKGGGRVGGEGGVVVLSEGDVRDDSSAGDGGHDEMDAAVGPVHAAAATATTDLPATDPSGDGGKEVDTDEEAAVDEAAAAGRAYLDDTSATGSDVASLGPYRLHGIISHLGSSPLCGHYVVRPDSPETLVEASQSTLGLYLAAVRVCD